MRTIAKFLRKLADFIDPRVAPSETMTIVINCDTSEAIREIDKVSQCLGEILRLKASIAD